jgi:hypothetical protein
MENLNQRTDLIELHGLEFITNQQGSMFVHDCSIYKTKFENVFISDYDLTNDKPLFDKDLLMLFYKSENKREYTYISIVMMDDVEFVNNHIKTQLIDKI